MTDKARAELAPTGVLRASINLGNPVLAHGTPADPHGVTVDIARELGARLMAAGGREILEAVYGAA